MKKEMPAVDVGMLADELVQGALATARRWLETVAPEAPA
jgi:hypothetical protein